MHTRPTQHQVTSLAKTWSTTFRLIDWSPGGFGHPALPTLIPAGVLSQPHTDQEPQIPNSDISAYSQVCKPNCSTRTICIDFTLRSLVLPSRVDCLQRHLHRPHQPPSALPAVAGASPSGSRRRKQTPASPPLARVCLPLCPPTSPLCQSRRTQG